MCSVELSFYTQVAASNGSGPLFDTTEHIAGRLPTRRGECYLGLEDFKNYFYYLRFFSTGSAATGCSLAPPVDGTTVTLAGDLINVLTAGKEPFSDAGQPS